MALAWLTSQFLRQGQGAVGSIAPAADTARRVAPSLGTASRPNPSVPPTRPAFHSTVPPACSVHAGSKPTAPERSGTTRSYPVPVRAPYAAVIEMTTNVVVPC